MERAQAEEDEGLAIDGKTMRSAIDDEGHQTHTLKILETEPKRSEDF